MMGWHSTSDFELGAKRKQKGLGYQQYLSGSPRRLHLSMVLLLPNSATPEPSHGPLGTFSIQTIAASLFLVTS